MLWRLWARSAFAKASADLRQPATRPATLKAGRPSTRKAGKLQAGKKAGKPFDGLRVGGTLDRGETRCYGVVLKLSRRKAERKCTGESVWLDAGLWA